MAKRFDRDAILKLPHADIRARYQAMFGEAPRSPNKVWMVNQMEERHAERREEKKAERATSKAPTPAKPQSREASAESLPLEDAAPNETVREDARAEAEEVGATTASDTADQPDADASPAKPDDDDSHDASTRRERGRFRGMTVEELRTLYTQKIGRPTSSSDKPYLIWKLLQADKGKIRLGPVMHGQRLEGRFANNDRTLPLTMTADAVAAVDEAWPRVGFSSRMSFMRAAIREALASRGETDAAAHFPDAAPAAPVHA